MASSSSSTPPRNPRPYEVFISFRGEDTRNSFVSHLYSALDARGIRTYFDETNIQRGHTITIELMKAIEESSVAIIVFSSNYGSSTWCLNELVKIIECKNKSGLVVFPIFYDVQPSDVRWQINSFSGAFSVHEVNFKDNGEIVKIWRESLREVADLAGEEIRGKNEASCIKKIADKILRQLPERASNFRKSLVGMESLISEITELIYNKPNEIIFIGLCGMGGIGKTTTAKAIFEDCKNKFEGSCFLKDVRQSKNRLESLQMNLLSSVLKTEIKDIYDVVEGSSMIQDRFQFKEVLLVVDDVDDIEQLNALAKQCDWFGRGSRIIITTRDEHLINYDHIQKYNVQTLPEKEALHLFCLHAFKNVQPPEDYKELSLNVLKYAGGLPLALQVLGDHLYRRDIYVWESTLSRLKDVPEDKIISKLQISFDGLNVLQQNIFLNLACFFRGYAKDSVEERLESLCLHPKEGIDVLIQKSIINISIEDIYFNGQHRYCIEMHDLVQEMGWYIVRQRANWDVKRYTRLWLQKDIVNVLSHFTVSSDAEGICMNIDSYLDNDVIKSKLGWERAFRNMNNLSFLELRGDLFKGNYNVNVFQSFGQLDDKLRWFSWSHYKGQSLPKRFHPMNLVHLHMEDSEIKKTPDFSHLPNLEVLNLCSSKMLVHVHPSLGNHMKVKRINLKFCEKLEKFPKINQMISLEILNLSYTNLQSFPEICGSLDSLRKLKLKGPYINVLPASIKGNATRLQKLKFACNSPHDEFTSLEVVPGSFPGLVRLEIIGSGIMRTLDFSQLPYLEKLDLSYSEKLVEVDASLGVHKRIKSINLWYCSNLARFPKIVDMYSLEELNLSGTSLLRFPEIEGNLSSLVKLHLDGTNITTLPWTIGRATSLKFVSLEGCDYLVAVPLSFLGLHLQRTYISTGAFRYVKESKDDEVLDIDIHCSMHQEKYEGPTFEEVIIDRQVWGHPLEDISSGQITPHSNTRWDDVFECFSSFFPCFTFLPF